MAKYITTAPILTSIPDKLFFFFLYLSGLLNNAAAAINSNGFLDLNTTNSSRSGVYILQ
jgi:hypothetical protein